MVKLCALRLNPAELKKVRHVKGREQGGVFFHPTNGTEDEAHHLVRELNWQIGNYYSQEHPDDYAERPMAYIFGQHDDFYAGLSYSNGTVHARFIRELLSLLKEKRVEVHETYQ